MNAFKQTLVAIVAAATLGATGLASARPPSMTTATVMARMGGYGYNSHPSYGYGYSYPSYGYSHPSYGYGYGYGHCHNGYRFW